MEKFGGRLTKLLQQSGTTLPGVAVHPDVGKELDIGEHHVIIVDVIAEGRHLSLTDTWFDVKNEVIDTGLCRGTRQVDSRLFFSPRIPTSSCMPSKRFLSVFVLPMSRTRQCESH